MEKVRYGIIGVGNMGSTHAKNFLKGKIENGVLTAICDIKPQRMEAVTSLELEGAKDVATFTDYHDMFKSGLIDAVIIAVPHYFHPPMAIEAFHAGLHVVCEKPAGVYTKQVKEMNAEAAKTDKLFTMMFNQRTNCFYRKMHEMVQNGDLGEIRRVNWIITDWYRAQCYYDSGDWRATWQGGFGAPKATPIEIETDGKDPAHVGILNNFSNAILGLEPLYVKGQEGLRGVEIMDAMLLSTWLGKAVTLPIDDDLYYNELQKRVATGRVKKVEEKVFDTSGTYGNKGNK